MADFRVGAHTHQDFGEPIIHPLSRPISLISKLLEESSLKIKLRMVAQLYSSRSEIFADRKCIRSLAHQAENEYSGFQPPYTEDFAYEAQLLKDFVSHLSANATVLLIYPRGAQVSWFLSQRTMLGLEDTSPVSISMVGTFSWQLVLSRRTQIDPIIGYDSYPNGFDCAHPQDWLPAAVPEYARCLSSASDA